MSPVVSVIMAAYNASRFIEAAIQSAQAQTLTDFELIVVDDCSSDNTVALVSRMAEADPRIRLFQMPKNGGPGAARHLGVAKSAGEWVAVQDADDKMLPNRLERLISVARENSFEVIADNLNYVNEDSGERFGTAVPLTDEGAISTITAEQFILANLPGEIGFKLGFLKPVIRRSFLVDKAINYHEELRVAEDYQFLFDMLVARASFGFLNEALYDYVIRPDSVSHTYSENELLKIAEINRENLDIAAVQQDPSIRAAVERRQLYCDRNAAFVRILGRVRGRQPFALLVTLVQTLPYMPYIVWRVVRVLSKGRVWSVEK